MSSELIIPSNHFILCHPFLLPSIFPSIRVFSNESALCITWPKYWSFSISPFNEYSRLISFRIDWFDLAVQGILESLLQHHNLKAFFSAQSSLWSNSHIHMWLLKSHSFDYWTFVGKVMSLVFNMVFSFITAFLPRRKHLLILWLQSISAVSLEPKNVKSVSVSTFYPSICHEMMWPDAMILVFECWVLSQPFYSSLSPSSRGFSSS